MTAEIIPLFPTAIEDEVATDEVVRHEFVDVPPAAAYRKSPGKLRKAYERGMSTAEYAVGILGVMAFALVVFRAFTDSDVAQRVLSFVVQLIERFAQLAGLS